MVPLPREEERGVRRSRRLDRIRDLIDYGTKFTENAAGDYSLHREGGHSHRRILHADDLTGAEVIRALVGSIGIVAAVGNDGPAAPPQYPASYPGVVAVTGVDARGRALPEAGKASHLDFAAPGADMAAALPGQGYAKVRGTSFAAPFATARLAIARVEDCDGGFSGRCQGSLHMDMHARMANVEQRLDAGASGTGRLPYPLLGMLANRAELWQERVGGTFSGACATHASCAASTSSSQATLMSASSR